MKQLGILLLVCVSFLTACQKKPVAVSNEPPIDFPATLQQAKSENKYVLLEFTGSDWCPPCIAMHENIFSKPEFNEYIKPHTLHVIVDFPNEKPQSDAQKKANEELTEKFKVGWVSDFCVVEFRRHGESGAKAACRRHAKTFICNEAAKKFKQRQ